MRELTIEQMNATMGGDAADTACGIAVGATIGASLIWGGIGFALTINKAIAACTIAIAT